MIRFSANLARAEKTERAGCGGPGCTQHRAPLIRDSGRVPRSRTRIVMRGIAGLILSAAAMAGSGSSQEATREMHVKDIRAEQPNDVILGSPLCQRVRASSDSASLRHRRNLDPATIETTLEGLMEKSDAVVLGTITDVVTEIAPSGADVVQYVDVRVLRTWKGSHKVGEAITFAIPDGFLHCTQSLTNDQQAFSTTTGDSFWGAPYSHPNILFLRQSEGDETQLTPGLRLTAADGKEGDFVALLKPQSDEWKTCFDLKPGNAEKCNAILEVSQTPTTPSLYLISSPEYYRLWVKMIRLPFSTFLKEVQSAADSLGYSAQAERGK